MGKCSILIRAAFNLLLICNLFLCCTADLSVTYPCDELLVRLFYFFKKNYMHEYVCILVQYTTNLFGLFKSI